MAPVSSHVPLKKFDLQQGQTGCRISHSSAQLRWKTWMHLMLGEPQTRSPFTYSPRQIGQQLSIEIFSFFLLTKWGLHFRSLVFCGITPLSAVNLGSGTFYISKNLIKVSCQDAISNTQTFSRYTCVITWRRTWILFCCSSSMPGPQLCFHPSIWGMKTMRMMPEPNHIIQ